MPPPLEDPCRDPEGSKDDENAYGLLDLDREELDRPDWGAPPFLSVSVSGALVMSPSGDTEVLLGLPPLVNLPLLPPLVWAGDDLRTYPAGASHGPRSLQNCRVEHGDGGGSGQVDSWRGTHGTRYVHTMDSYHLPERWGGLGCHQTTATRTHEGPQGTSVGEGQADTT